MHGKSSREKGKERNERKKRLMGSGCPAGIGAQAKGEPHRPG